MTTIIKHFIISLSFLFIAKFSWAHAYWIETKSTGNINKEHTIKVFFAETGEEPEKTNGKEWLAMKNFDLYLLGPDHQKIKLNSIATEDSYTASFIPKQKGHYIVVLQNADIGVLGDSPEYMYIPYYYSTAYINVDNTQEKLDINKVLESIPLALLTIVDEKNIDVSIKSYDNTEAGLYVNGPDGKYSMLQAKQPTKAVYNVLGKGKYYIELMIIDKKGGALNGKNYKTAYHIATSMVEVD